MSTKCRQPAAIRAAAQNIRDSRERVYRYDVGLVEEHCVRTEVDLKRGNFVGLYPGIWIDGMCTTLSDYSFDADGEFTVVPPPRKGGKRKRGCRGKPDAGRYPLTCINQPKPNERANVAFKMLRKSTELAAGLPSVPIAAIAIFATEDIAAGSDLRLHYGKVLPPRPRTLRSLCECDSPALGRAPLRQVRGLAYGVGDKARSISVRECESPQAHLTAAWLPAGAYVMLE